MFLFVALYPLYPSIPSGIKPAGEVTACGFHFPVMVVQVGFF
jgi:hypothetical protein